jgi:hypothetical protein
VGENTGHRDSEYQPYRLRTYFRFYHLSAPLKNDVAVTPDNSVEMQYQGGFTGSVCPTAPGNPFKYGKVDIFYTPASVWIGIGKIFYRNNSSINFLILI